MFSHLRADFKQSPQRDVVVLWCRATQKEDTRGFKWAGGFHNSNTRGDKTRIRLSAFLDLRAAAAAASTNKCDCERRSVGALQICSGCPGQSLSLHLAKNFLSASTSIMLLAVDDVTRLSVFLEPPKRTTAKETRVLDSSRFEADSLSRNCR